MASKTPTTIKNEARKGFFVELQKIFGDNCTVIGDNEIAVKVGTSPENQPIYAIISPTIKDYCDRVTRTKTIKAFDLEKAKADYLATLEKREEEQKEKAEKKARAIANCEKARARAKAKKEG